MRNAVRWTPEEDAFLRKNATLTQKALALQLGRTSQAVSCRCTSLGIRVGQSNPSNIRSTPEGFLAVVEPDPFGGCWLWTGAMSPNGYGAVSDAGVMRTAHGMAWRLFRGDVPAGLCVCHRCDVRACVNPDHLWLGTDAENAADKVAKGRHGQKPRKLTEAQVLDVLADPRGEREVAAEYGVSTSLIGAIRRGERRRPSSVVTR
jgi:hypothetical protein